MKEERFLASHSLSAVADQIIAFIPVYCDRGEATELWLKDNTSLLDVRSINSCLHEFWRHYSFDWHSYRRQYAVALNRKNLLPWPADIWRTFAPAKLRLPQIDGDAAYGYFAVECIEAVLPTEPGSAAASALIFQDGRRLPVYLASEELHRHLQAAAFTFQLYWGRRLELRPTFRPGPQRSTGR